MIDESGIRRFPRRLVESAANTTQHDTITPPQGDPEARLAGVARRSHNRIGRCPVRMWPLGFERALGKNAPGSSAKGKSIAADAPVTFVLLVIRYAQAGCSRESGDRSGVESEIVLTAEPSPGEKSTRAGSPAQADRPVRGDSAPVLYDGSEDGRLLPQLLDRLSDRALDRIDMAVSFVMKSGLARILRPLEDALDRGAHVRILTTDYLAITDPDALTQLADLAEDPDRRLEVRLFSGGSVAFHPKAYIFWSSAGETAAGYVGSSNLSASGIDGGVEWNLGTDRVEQLVAGFESLWTDGRSKPLDATILGEYRETWRKSARSVVAPEAEPSDEPPAEPSPPAPAEDLRRLVGVADELPTQPVAPRPIQAEALEALEQTRAEGFDRAFVVMATGLGKTWLAAFDLGSRTGRVASPSAGARGRTVRGAVPCWPPAADRRPPVCGRARRSVRPGWPAPARAQSRTTCAVASNSTRKPCFRCS